MASSTHRHSTLEEKLIVATCAAYWPIYLLGGLYVAGSLLCWLVAALVALRWLVEGERAFRGVSPLALIWLGAMLVMLLALWVGHSNFELGIGKTIKSTIGWMKGWGLIGLAIVLGSLLPIHQQQLVRALSITAIGALPFLAISAATYLVGGPEVVFTSPLKVVGGPGPEFFELRLFGTNPETGLPRWFFFTPWAPAAGLLSCLLLLIVMHEQQPLLRALAILGCLTICLASQSRAGIAVMLLVTPLVLCLQWLRLAPIAVLAIVALPAIVLLGTPVFEWLQEFAQQVRESRPGSTRVRDALADIALQRWQDEAPIWGHGIVERGPKAVEFMPIGTHHSWYGLLFTKGIVGALALAVPMALSLAYLAIHSQQARSAVTALGLLLVMALFSFFENLEILAYLYWPALIWLGAALNPRAIADDKPPAEAVGKTSTRSHFANLPA